MAIIRLEQPFDYVGKTLNLITKDEFELIFYLPLVESVTTRSVSRCIIVKVDYSNSDESSYFYLAPNSYEEWKKEYGFHEQQKVNWQKEGF